MTVGVLITNYNSWELAFECARENIRLCGDRLTQILILDDCSSQEMPLEIPQHPCLRIEHNAKNIGFASTLNQGIQKLDTDIVVIFDADAKPVMDYFSGLVQSFREDATVAAVGFRAVDEQNRPTPSRDTEPNIHTLLLGQALYARYKKWADGNNKNIYLCTCALAVRKKAFEELGGFDEAFSWLDVDVDFSMNVNRSRWSLQTNDSLVAFHKGGGTPMQTADRVLHFYRSRWKLLKKYGLVQNVPVTKMVVVTRLWIEYLFLLVMGPVLFKNRIVREDKIKGRRKIIEFCTKEF